MKRLDLWMAARLCGAAGCLVAAVWIVWSAGLPDRARANAIAPVQPGEIPTAPEVGAIAPPIQAVDIHGQGFSLSALRGHPVIVNFWATWCTPCLEEMPALQGAAYAHPDLRVAGVNVGERRAEVRAWIEQLDLRFDIVIDSDGLLSRFYRVRGLPMTFFIDREGIIRRIAFGPVTREQIDAAIALLAG